MLHRLQQIYSQLLVHENLFMKNQKINQAIAATHKNMK